MDNRSMEEMRAERLEAAMDGLSEAIRKAMMLRQHLIIDGMSEDNVDKHIADIGKEYMDKYSGMSRIDLMIEMLTDMAESVNRQEEMLNGGIE